MITPKQAHLLTRIAKRVSEEGGRLYYCGGFVRDSIMGKENSDVDVKAIDISKNEYIRILEEFGEVKWINAKFELAKLNGNSNVDFASPEDKEGNIKTLDDIMLHGSDFTMNGILIDVLTQQVIDYYDGVTDISNKIIKISNKDNEDKFISLRACRFASKLGFEIDKETKKEMQGYSYDNIPPMRVWQELQKVMREDCRPSVFLESAKELNLLGNLLCPLKELTKQQTNGITELEHTERALDYLTLFKEKIKNYQSIFMALLTYHFNDHIDRYCLFREFKENVRINTGIVGIMDYMESYSSVVFNAYNKMDTMSDYDFEKAVRTKRSLFKDLGYFVEAYNMGRKENITKEDYEASEKRLQAWEARVSATIEKIEKPSIKSAITKPEDSKKCKKSLPKTVKSSTRRYVSKPKSGYTLGEVMNFTMQISENEMTNYLSNSFEKVSNNKRRRANSGRD